MRYPLRYQIIAPLMGVMLLAVASLVLWQAIASSDRTTHQVETRLRGVARTLSESNFPLTRPVLEQMKGLSGAEFLLIEGDRSVATRGLQSTSRDWGSGAMASDWRKIVLDHRVTLGDQVFFHASVMLPQRQVESGRGESGQPQLHLFYPQDDFRRAWREAVAPPLLMGGLAIVATGLCGVWIAHRISLTANQITRHVRRIAQGDFRPFPVPLQQDELGDLVRDINTMAEQLKLYEAKIRRTEQEKILEQLGSGLAHEIRNAVTGARMALQIHAGECPLEECESLAIATRQLQIMENQLQRYLQLSRTQETIDPKSVDLTAMLEHLLPLMRPLAEHLLVVLAWDRPTEPIHAMANREALEQVILNLLQNGIEAAAAQSYSASAERQVQLSLQQTAASAVHITVTDSGAGPSSAVRDRLFEKFATDKLHGTGLGLSVSRDIVQQHDGTLTWKRDGDRTVFTVQLPGLPQEVLDVENSCR